MKRTRATAVTLLNWRGVFYGHYELDPNVTALEGTNGAGKTTVMIAAYVVLLPDMGRLRFTNVGEHGPSGGDKGIWGRLGGGGPSYALLEFSLPSRERLVAGVALERRSEPSVEAIPFVISGLADDLRLQDVLLDRGEVDTIVSLPRMRELAARKGAELETFASAKDYFSVLFDRGVLPLRLASDEERTKFNEMLRTSMMGGISRTLTSDLRDFMLREETGLADTLLRMRTLLDACHRTRLEVTDARRLEQEIRNVYEVGQEMFAAALHAIRERAEESKKRLDDASAALARTEFERDQAEAAAERADAAAREAAEAVTRAEARKGETESRLTRVRQAAALDARIRDREDARDRSTAAVAAAQSALAQATAARDAAVRQEQQAGGDRDRAARGLADARKGIEELELRANLYRLVQARVEVARTIIGDAPIAAANVASLVGGIRVQIQQLDRELAALDRLLSGALQQRADFARVHAALERLVASRVAAGDAHASGLRALGEQRELAQLAGKATVLPNLIADARTKRRQQEEVRQAAAAQSTPDEPIRAFADVVATLGKSQAERDRHDGEERAATGRAAEARRQRDRAEAEVRAGAERVSLWRLASERKQVLENAAACSVTDAQQLEELTGGLEDRRRVAQRESDGAEAARRECHTEAARLEQMGGTFAATVLEARDAVDGDLLANRFEDLAIDQAAKTEALLGPLSSCRDA